MILIFKTYKELGFLLIFLITFLSSDGQNVVEKIKNKTAKYNRLSSKNIDSVKPYIVDELSKYGIYDIYYHYEATTIPINRDSCRVLFIENKIYFRIPYSELKNKSIMDKLSKYFYGNRFDSIKKELPYEPPPNF